MQPLGSSSVQHAQGHCEVGLGCGSLCWYTLLTSMLYDVAPISHMFSCAEKALVENSLPRVPGRSWGTTSTSTTAAVAAPTPLRGNGPSNSHAACSLHQLDCMCTQSSGWNISRPAGHRSMQLRCIPFPWQTVRSAEFMDKLNHESVASHACAFMEDGTETDPLTRIHRHHYLPSLA